MLTCAIEDAQYIKGISFLSLLFMYDYLPTIRTLQVTIRANVAVAKKHDHNYNNKISINDEHKCNNMSIFGPRWRSG
jgi:hypothetical protein